MECQDEFSFIFPAAVDEMVQDTSCVSPDMKVYTKYDLPTRFHYTRNDRIDQIVVVMNDTWAVDRLDFEIEIETLRDTVYLLIFTPN